MVEVDSRPLSALHGVISLELELFRLFPGEFLAGEMPVLCSLVVDGVGQVQFLDNDTS
jgi:hypothetical protein